MQSKAKTAKQYIAELPEDRKAVIKTIDALILRALPQIGRERDVFMMYGMLGYGKFRYKTKSGVEGDWAVVGLANQKDYISVYLSAADEKGYIAEQNKERLGKVSVGKSCIRFKKLEDIRLDVLEELIKKSYELVKSRGLAV